MGWRGYEASDKEAVDTMHAQMESRLGMKFPLAELDKRPSLVGLVYERDGVVTNAAQLEAQAEIVLLGEVPLPLKEWDKAAKAMRTVCEGYRIRSVHAFIPNAALIRSRPKKPTAIERILKHFGFVREDQSEVTPYSKWIGKD